jgi:DNA polymerase-1
MSNPVNSSLDHFYEVVLLDTEFVARDGEPVMPVCLVAHELHSGRRHRVFFQDPGAHYENPLPQGPDVLYVAYAAQAECSTFLQLGWDLPEYMLDLFGEFRAITNGLTNPAGAPIKDSLIGALEYFGLDSMSVVEKESMRNLILRGGPYTQTEKEAILDYCSEDVEALGKLLPVMLPLIDVPYAVFRARYTGPAVARMERTGIPIDVPTLNRLKANWGLLRERIAADIEAEYGFGVYVRSSWNHAAFTELVERIGLMDEWPRTNSGTMLSVEDKVFKTMAARYPELQPLRDLRAVTRLHEIMMPVGKDGYNRCPVVPLRSVTGRNYPSTLKFAFGPFTWLRPLIQPQAGRAIAYVDWSSAEFGIAAALSGDKRMQAAYESGDVYLSFAKDAGAAPLDATKATHSIIRELYKQVVLAVQYEQTALGLARKLGVAPWQAQELLDLHRRVYSRYWDWSEWMSQSAVFGRRIETVFRWPMHVTARTKPRTIANFPMQANGSEMLRWACIFATESGITVHAPVQDALLVGGSIEEIGEVVAATQDAMDRASDLVLDGFVLRTEAKIVRFPDRYIDERGVQMWNRIIEQLDTLGGSQ